MRRASGRAGRGSPGARRAGARGGRGDRAHSAATTARGAAVGPRRAAVLRELSSLANPAAVVGMVRYGIRPHRALGVSTPQLRAMARRIGRSHELALALWDSGVHDARHLACLIDEPARVTVSQMEDWARDFRSWDLCDNCCCNLFDRTPHAYDKALEWSGARGEFVKRAGFTLMAALAVHDRAAGDGPFVRFLARIRGAGNDERNYVKKAVNWALRQTGKRNPALHRRALATAEALRASGTRAARWIAADALRELRSDAVRARLRAKRALVDPARGRRARAAADRPPGTHRTPRR